MGAAILTIASEVHCPHGGFLRLQTSNSAMNVLSAPALLVTDIHPVVGCPLNVLGVPSPCVTARWLAGSVQTNVLGIAVVLQDSPGLCYNALQVPQGPTIVVAPNSGSLGS